MTARDNHAGTVTQDTQRIIRFEVDIPAREMPDAEESEYVILVNGHVVKRMHAWQARRLGLVT
jgi:hypothetical protein